jgi:hypothetical protein
MRLFSHRVILEFCVYLIGGVEFISGLNRQVGPCHGMHSIGTGVHKQVAKNSLEEF